MSVLMTGIHVYIPLVRNGQTPSLFLYIGCAPQMMIGMAGLQLLPLMMMDSSVGLAVARCIRFRGKWGR